MFCPECCQAQLKFVPEGKTHRAYLSAIDTEKHSDVCGYRYDSSPTKYTKLHFDKLTNAQIEDKMASILRMLDSKNLNGGNVGKPRLPNVNANPFILSSDDEKKSCVRKTLPRRHLNRPLKSEDTNLLCAFYADNVSLSTVVRQKQETVPSKDEYGNIIEKEETFYHSFLKITTANQKTYSVYRGRRQENTPRDIVYPKKRYSIVLIGKFANPAPNKFKEIDIDLIRNEKNYRMRPLQNPTPTNSRNILHHVPAVFA
ncbi:hypothetical protein [Neisseria weaveri]|uniref:hypothetical protein n=1 Tax=Neisseria weaveri TaxID=28091 RepID=UPI00131A8A5F|nr:hypothetical protein [Neisseria weaveri]